MRLDGLFREEEALTDLPVHEAVSHELQHLDFPGGRLLREFPQDRRVERDHCTGAARAAPGSRCLEAAAVVSLSVEDLLTLGRVHESGIGARGTPL